MCVHSLSFNTFIGLSFCKFCNKNISTIVVVIIIIDSTKVSWCIRFSVYTDSSIILHSHSVCIRQLYTIQLSMHLISSFATEQNYGIYIFETVWSALHHTAKNRNTMFVSGEHFQNRFELLKHFTDTTKVCIIMHKQYDAEGVFYYEQVHIYKRYLFFWGFKSPACISLSLCVVVNTSWERPHSFHLCTSLCVQHLVHILVSLNFHMPNAFHFEIHSSIGRENYGVFIL